MKMFPVTQSGMTPRLVAGGARYRRDCVGELIQIDGSEHRWFEKTAGR
jgi:hypothetical protein